MRTALIAKVLNASGLAARCHAIRPRQVRHAPRRMSRARHGRAGCRACVTTIVSWHVSLARLRVPGDRRRAAVGAQRGPHRLRGRPARPRRLGHGRQLLLGGHARGGAHGGGLHGAGARPGSAGGARARGAPACSISHLYTSVSGCLFRTVLESYSERYVPSRAESGAAASPRRVPRAGRGAQAVEAVLAGAVASAFAVVRPPGHHAECARAMGFCFYNNVAVAALAARRAGARPLVLDWDVHHGNGIQDILWEEDIAYVSLHRRAQKSA